jgi:hypothetical protein
MIVMVIIYVGLRNDYKGQFFAVNSEITVANIKYYHLSYTHLLCYINLYYEYKTQTKASLNAHAH